MNNIASAVINLAQTHFEDFKIRNGQLVTTFCPFCNGGSSHDKDTFAVGLENGAFSCLRGSCGKTGSYKELCELFGEKPVVSISSFKAKEHKKNYVLPQIELKPITDEIETYFALRKIGRNTLEAFGVSSDTNGNIVFPFYRNSELTYVKYRKPKKHTKEDGPKEWQMANTEPILFGMDNVSFNKPLIITEGEIDALSIYEAGYHNVVSVPCGCKNMDWVSICWEWLDKFKQFILFGDSDEPGQEMVNSLLKRLGEDKCMIPPAYPEMIVGDTNLNRACKDANEILYAYGEDGITQLIERCEPSPIKGILNLADVPFVDPTNLPRIYTRIPSLDSAIGGLGEGSVTVWSGKRGEGKSTMAGTIALNAVQQGMNVCAYSGELPAEKFLEWIMLQATERKYIEHRIDPRSCKEYAVVPHDVQKSIRKWLDERFFLFDNNYTPDIPQDKAIINIFTACVKKYGCKLFIVDNLMTILSGSDEINENKAQANFVASLKNFAVKYKVAVMLVAHPRKTKPGETFSSEDISGAAAISNLADFVINIEKPNIRVTKNRENGCCPFIECDFDPCNRRIFEHMYGDKTIYGWDHNGIKEPDDPACNYEAFAIQLGNYEGTQPF